MYNYYYIATDCRSNTWNTTEIQDYLRSFTIFEEKSNGIFISKNSFLDISLMKVKDLNSWSSLDFDKDETNYVSIVTSGYWNRYLLPFDIPESITPSFVSKVIDWAMQDVNTEIVKWNGKNIPV